VASLADSAAVRALDIDRSNVNARLARISIRPPFRRWAEAENAVVPLWKQEPRNWAVAAYLGRLAAETGRFDAALEHFGRALEIEPLLPRIFGQLAFTNWALGRLHEAEQLLDSGMERWPRSWFLWSLRFQFLAFQGETAAARRQVTDASATPWNLAPTGVPKRIQLIQALESRDRAEIEKAKATHLAEAVEFVRAVPRVSLVLAALDCRDELFDLLRGYYLDVGPYARKIAAYSRRSTAHLFLPPMRSLHSDPRFAALRAAIGLGRG
jgi:tetratricopeptide (TPR) repeat protein